MKEFKGRVVVPGTCKAEALVSRNGFNTLASFQMALMFNKAGVPCGDQNNPDINGKPMQGKALCLPITIGSTTGGLVIQTICAMGVGPACFLFSEHIDSLAASGIVLAKVWENSNVICIDMLGQEFLDSVNTGDKIEVKEDGTVILL